MGYVSRTGIFSSVFLNSIRLRGTTEVRNAERLVQRELHDVVVVVEREWALECVDVSVHAGAALESGVQALRVVTPRESPRAGRGMPGAQMTQ